MAENLEKISGLICAYNEEKTIADVVAESRKYIHPIIVVNDGSTDRTADRAKRAGAIILTHKTNLGKGAALRTGFDDFLEKDYGAVVTLDADGQHKPADIGELVKKCKEGYDVVIAKRDFRSRVVPLSRKAGNFIDSFTLSALLSKEVYDPQNGFRIFKRETLERIKKDAHIIDNGFLYETKLVVYLIKNNFKVGWADVTTIYSPERKSKLDPLKHAAESLKLYGKLGKENILEIFKYLS